MKITALQEYGMRILLQLAERRENLQPVRIRAIAQREALSVDYVEKILTRLRRAGLVKSVRGLNGGYALARSPEKLSVGESIMALTERPIEVSHIKKDLCGQFTGNRLVCTHLSGCSIRQLWSMVILQVYGNLNRIYLSDLLGNESVVHNRLTEFVLKSKSSDGAEPNPEKRAGTEREVVAV